MFFLSWHILDVNRWYSFIGYIEMLNSAHRIFQIKNGHMPQNMHHLLWIKTYERPIMKRTVEITSVLYMTWMILYITVKSGSVFMI